jgi:uncharacterized protein YegP (UPF0339 family)
MGRQFGLVGRFPHWRSHRVCSVRDTDPKRQRGIINPNRAEVKPLAIDGRQEYVALMLRSGHWGAGPPHDRRCIKESPMTVPRRRWMALTAGAVVAGLAPFRETSGALAGGLTFEIYKDAKQEFRWRLKASNGQVIATSGQGYKSKADCRHGIEVIQKEAAEAKVIEAEEKSKKA